MNVKKHKQLCFGQCLGSVDLDTDLAKKNSSRPSKYNFYAEVIFTILDTPWEKYQS